LIQLCDDMVLGQRMDHQLLQKYGFNRWNADGTSNVLNASAKGNTA
jgi:hypothetical protein